MRKKLVVMVVAIAMLISAGIASARPDIVVSVSPTEQTVLVGETATYQVSVSALETLMDVETVTLDVNNKIPDATYTFSQNGFEIGPYPDKKTATLKIGIPSSTTPGIYPQTVAAEAEWMGIPAWEYSDFTTYVDVQPIPEFPTVAIPAIAIIGLVFLFNKRRRG